MREIKFRTYDVISESFIYYTLQDIINWIKNMQNWVNWDQNQYTWLKDKNGKEIYEGDIIKQSWKKYLSERIRTVFNLEECNCLMIGNKYYNHTIASEYNEIRNNWNDIEIIWNIYENSNLLKK